MVILFLLFSIVFSNLNAINVLVYSPAFAASHTNFMARLADTLTEAGHNVTFLVPIVDVARRNQLGVRITTDVVVVEHDELASQESVPFDDSMEVYWTEKTDSSNVEESFKWFFDGMEVGCENLLRQKHIFDLMKSRNFDVAILEPLAVCGLGFFKKLGIEKTILASSCAYYDFLFRHLGEPNEYSYLPALMSTKGEKMSLMERFENYKVSEVQKVFQGMSRGMFKMFDKEQHFYRQYLGKEIPDWRELIPAASLYFTNSNPYLDFPRPVIQKTIPIGGVTVDMEKIKSTKLDSDWDTILSKRRLNLLISFGSMIHSSHMLTPARDNILRVIASQPDVTFIWKYETNDTSFAENLENVVFSQWVPQTALLADTRLSGFLTHGGLGSTNELAHLGKPAIVVPIFGDQYRNAHMLERHGCALIVEKTELDNWKLLKNSVKSILYDGKFKKNAMHLAELLRNQPLKPKELVVKYVEFVAKYGPFPEMDPYVRKLDFIQRNLLDVYLIEIIGHILFFSVIFLMTYLMPVIDIGKRDECIGVKLTKDLVIVEASEEMIARKKSESTSDEMMEAWWKSEMDSTNLRDTFRTNKDSFQMFKWFSSDMKIGCRNFHSRRDIFHQMKSRNFDVAILEPISVCGLGFVNALGIEKIILASSATFFDSVLNYIGEPLDFSYVPSLYSVTGEVMSMAERYENWVVLAFGTR
ncbi:CRE-UGT-27 protein [Caenorhabditis remanei]|uniref:glucuronosyltransferase n=1 Tax=Caenorhabditis remanei TaxID=31234 RepID=E3NGI5_CAERE|nr:CRE-UGT-27 protein [Caenorhabditis remanei]